jgi:ankyrin repeat protein
LEFQGLPYWNAWWETPLHIAASLGQREVAEVLLANGADVSARDSYFSTPLHRAALFGRNDVVELLIMWDADVNARDEDGQTPLDRAAEETVDLLRNHGAQNRFESRGTRD